MYINLSLIQAQSVVL